MYVLFPIGGMMSFLQKKNVGITRKKADELIKMFVENVKVANASEGFMHTVTRVTVFGSYLTNKEKLGDIDIGIWYENRPRKDGQDIVTVCKQVCEYHHRKIRSFMELMFMPINILIKFLKGGSKAISVHEGDESEKSGNYKVIYELGKV